MVIETDKQYVSINILPKVNSCEARTELIPLGFVTDKFPGLNHPATYLIAQLSPRLSICRAEEGKKGSIVFLAEYGSSGKCAWNSS